MPLREAENRPGHRFASVFSSPTSSGSWSCSYKRELHFDFEESTSDSASTAAGFAGTVYVETTIEPCKMYF